MKPAYFGSSSRPLFGVHELPRAAAGPVEARGDVVLLCYPGVQEYNMAHWAFRRLSSLLAREGFHVFRFDWSGTGDSWGHTADATPETWVGDVREAVHELRDASGAASVAIVGMRLGGAMAAIACSDLGLADELVLWDPVVRGRRYIAELEDLDARENTRLLKRIPLRRRELVGFPFPDHLRAAIEHLNLLTCPLPRVKRATLVVGSENEEYRVLEERLSHSGVDTHYMFVPEDAARTNSGQREAALLASRSLTAIVDHLRGGARP
jgi:pimeloyl-ACP methyl ester carboxylesterase